jgi:hypothetical protein
LEISSEPPRPKTWKRLKEPSGFLKATQVTFVSSPGTRAHPAVAVMGTLSSIVNFGAGWVVGDTRTSIRLPPSVPT